MADKGVDTEVVNTAAEGSHRLGRDHDDATEPNSQKSLSTSTTIKRLTPSVGSKRRFKQPRMPRSTTSWHGQSGRLSDGSTRLSTRSLRFLDGDTGSTNACIAFSKLGLTRRGKLHYLLIFALSALSALSSLNIDWAAHHRKQRMYLPQGLSLEIAAAESAGLDELMGAPWLIDLEL